MGTRALTVAVPICDAFQKLEEDLRTETTAEAILEHLTVLLLLLGDRLTAEDVAIDFLRADGLSTLIRHFRGTLQSDGTPDPGTTSRLIADRAAEAFYKLRVHDASDAALREATANLIPPSLHALRDAPTMLGRCVAMHMLMELAVAQPRLRKAIADSGVIKHVVAFYFALYNDTGEPPEGCDDPLDMVLPAWTLVSALVTGETSAAHELRQAIRAPKSGDVFATLILIQDCLAMDSDDCAFLAAFKRTGGVDALVETLEHESPFCVAAAAGALGVVGKAVNGGQSAVEASGAVPALVRVVKKQLPARALEGEMAMYQRAKCKLRSEDASEYPQLNSPTAMAVGSLVAAAAYTGPMRDSFLAAKGVPALLRTIRESRCAQSINYSLDLLSCMLEDVGPSGRQNCRQEFAETLFNSGICQAALQVMRRGTKDSRKRCFIMFFLLFQFLSYRSDLAAIKLLGAGDFVTLTARYMVEAGTEMHPSAVLMMLKFLGVPQGRQQACAPEVCDQLLKGLAKWLQEADGRLWHHLPRLLLGLLDWCPPFLPAAGKANLLPGLVCVMRKCAPGQQRGTEKTEEVGIALRRCCLCLMLLAEQFEANDAMAFWKPAFNAGLVDLLVKLLEKLQDELELETLLELCGYVLLAPPRGMSNRWVKGLPRAITALIVARPPIAPFQALQLLVTITIRRDVVLDFHTWGVYESIQRLTTDSNPDTARKAKGLLFMVDEGLDREPSDMRSQMGPANPPPDGVNRPLWAMPDALRSQRERDFGAADQRLADRANTAVACTLGPIRSGPAGRNRAGAGSRVEPGQGQPSRNLDPPVPGGAPSRVDASPGRRGRKVWACAKCEITAEMVESGKLQWCTGCRTVRYCGKVCQKADWPAHKATCKRLQSGQE